MNNKNTRTMKNYSKILNIVFVVPLLLHKKKVSHIFILFFNNGNIYSRYFKPFHLIIARYFYHKTTTLFLLDSILIKVFDILHHFPTKFRSEICDGALHLTLHDGEPYNTETSPLICSANQQTGFYMIRTSVMKVLTQQT